MHLDRVGHAASQRAAQDRRSHNQVVGQRNVGPGAPRHLSHPLGVGSEVQVELAVAQLGEGHGVEAVVLVGHVDRQDPADVGVMDGDGLGQSQAFRMALLAHEVHLVPEGRERSRQTEVVDVAARASQQVAVEDQYAQGGW